MTDNIYKEVTNMDTIITDPARERILDRSREHEEAPVCLACHVEIQGRHVIAWETTHFCTRCGSQLVRVGLAKYTTDRRTACQH